MPSRIYAFYASLFTFELTLRDEPRPALPYISPIYTQAHACSSASTSIHQRIHAEFIGQFNQTIEHNRFSRSSLPAGTRASTIVLASPLCTETFAACAGNFVKRCQKQHSDDTSLTRSQGQDANGKEQLTQTPNNAPSADAHTFTQESSSSS